jgi:hypothetical protein
MQVWSIQHRRDERAIGVEALTVGNRRLVPADAVKRAAVERWVIGKAGLDRGFDHRLGQGVVWMQDRWT